MSRIPGNGDFYYVLKRVILWEYGVLAVEFGQLYCVEFAIVVKKKYFCVLCDVALCVGNKNFRFFDIHIYGSNCGQIYLFMGVSTLS